MNVFMISPGGCVPGAGAPAERLLTVTKTAARTS